MASAVFIRVTQRVTSQAWSTSFGHQRPCSRRRRIVAEMQSSKATGTGHVDERWANHAPVANVIADEATGLVVMLSLVPGDMI